MFQIQQLHKQIETLHVQRQQNNIQQINLQKQINVLLSDNQVLHQQLNNLIQSQNSESLRRNIEDQDSNKQSRSIQGNQDPLKSYEYEYNPKNREIEQNQHNFYKQKESFKIKRGQSIEKQIMYQSSVPEQAYKAKINELEAEVLQLKKQNQKLCEVNDKIINNFTELKDSFQEFQEKQGKSDPKELQKQVEYLTQQLENIVNINHMITHKYNKLKLQLDKRSDSWIEDNPEIKPTNNGFNSSNGVNGYRRKGSHPQKPLQFNRQFAHLHNDINQLKNKMMGIPPESRNYRGDAIKLEDHEGESQCNYLNTNTDQKQYVTFNKFYSNKNKSNVKPHRLEESKQQSISEVETLVHLANKLENQLRMSQNLYYQLSASQAHQQQQHAINPQLFTFNNKVQKNNYHIPNQPHAAPRMSPEDYYRWMSYQDRIKHLNNQNNQLRMWENRMYK